MSTNDVVVSTSNENNTLLACLAFENKRLTEENKRSYNMYKH